MSHKNNGGVVFVKVGAAKTKDVPTDKVVFDPRLQHRANLTDADAVKEYARRDSEGAKLPPIKAVHVTKDETGARCDLYYCYNGFQRGAAWLQNGKKTFPVEFIEGDFATAFFLSLSANGDESVLPRTSGDAMRSVIALIRDQVAFETVAKLARKRGSGGLHRLIAAAVGCAASVVDDALKSEGLSVRGDKLVKRATKPAKDDGGSGTGSGTGTGGTVVGKPEEEMTEDEKKAANAAALEEIERAVFAENLKEADALRKRLTALMVAMMRHPKHGATVVAKMKAHKIGTTSEFDVTSHAGVEAYYELQEQWPVASKLGQLFFDVKRTVAKIEEEEAAQAKKEEDATEPPAAEPGTDSASPSDNGEPKKKKAKKEPAAK